MIEPLTSFLDGLPFWQAALVVLGASILLAVAIQKVGVRAAKRLVSRTESRVDDIVFEELRLPIVTSVFLAGVWVLSQTQSVTNGLVTAAQLEQFFGTPSLSIIVLVWAWALNQVVNRSVETLQSEGRQFEFAPVLSNIWTLVVVAGAGYALLRMWHIDVTPLLGAAGIAGIAIGFAAKDTVANFFGGLALYFDDTYKLGDYVVLESGDAGTVVKVGIRSTTLLTRSEVLVTVPNSMLNAGKVINQSAPNRRKRIKVPIGVAYGTDIDAFEELVLDVAAAEDLVLERPEPRIRFRQFGPSALEYELLAWVPSPTRSGRATHELNRALYRDLQDAGIEIPFPKRDLVIRDERGPDGGAGTGSGPTSDV